MAYKVLITDYYYPDLEQERGVFQGTDIDIFDANGKCTTNIVKDGIYIVNTARGDIIVEGALLKALGEGKVAGAGLDVLADEVRMKGHPFLEMENVVVTPHMAWYSADSIKELQRKTAEQVKQALLYGRPKNQVNILPRVDG